MFDFLKKKLIRQNFYGLKVINYLTNLHFSEIVNIIDCDPEKLAHIPSEDYLPHTDGLIRTYKDGDLYAFYLDRVRIVINNGKEKLVKVSILAPKENWKMWELDAKGKNTAGIDSADSVAYTVYTYCDILMPTGKMMCDERYTKGTWNEYVYNTVHKIIDDIYSYKEKNKFNNFYKY